MKTGPGGGRTEHVNTFLYVRRRVRWRDLICLLSASERRDFFLHGINKRPIRTKDFQFGRREASRSPPCLMPLHHPTLERWSGFFSLSCRIWPTPPLRFSRNARESLRWERVTQAAVNLWPLYIHLLYNHSNPKQRLECEASPAAMFTLDH